MNLTPLGLLLSLCILLSFSGCKTFNKAKFNQGKGVSSDSILPIPLREPRQQLWYGESENGKLAVEAFKAWVSQNAEANFPDGDGVLKVMQQVLDWPEKGITARQWKQITAGLGIKYVVYGEITDFAVERPSKIGILDPHAVVSYWVVNVEQGKIVHQVQDMPVDATRGMETELPLTVLGSDAARLASRRLLAKIGEQIGKDLYGYYSE